MTHCIGQHTADQFIGGELAVDVTREVATHAAACLPCRLRIGDGGTPSLVQRRLDQGRGISERLRLGQLAQMMHYEVGEVIGSSGMGIVFAAYDQQLKRPVALKLLHPHSDVADSVGKAGLLHEAQSAAGLSHPNIVPIYAYGEFEGEAFIAMELVEGESLVHWLAAGNGGRRSWHEIVEVFVQAGEALAHSHTRQIAHGDFKPDNLLIDRTGRVRLIDFGLARSFASDPPRPEATDAVTGDEPDTIMGTARYLAPEQWYGRPADPRTDQFNFCVTLYEALHGRHPFGVPRGRSPMKPPKSWAVRAMPQDSDVPSWVQHVITRGLMYDRRMRYRSMEELLYALRQRAGRTAPRGVVGIRAQTGAPLATR